MTAAMDSHRIEHRPRRRAAAVSSRANESAGPSNQNNHPLLELQRAVGNRAVTRLVGANAEPIQRMQRNEEKGTKSVGYDKINTAMKGEKLLTASLGNCIAIACQDKNTGAASMIHLNTASILARPDQPGFAVAKLKPVKAALILALRTSIAPYALARAVPFSSFPQIEPTFHVSFGSGWATASGLEPLAVELSEAFNEVFPDAEGFGLGLVAEFDTETGKMSSTADLDPSYEASRKQQWDKEAGQKLDL